MPRILLCIALLAACAVEDAPPPAPPTGPTHDPQPSPSPRDAGDGDTDPPFPTGDGGSDIDAADLSCGDFGADCCPDAPFCAAEFTHCDEGLCAACGDIAQTCCNQGTPCQVGLSCDLGVCGP